MRLPLDEELAQQARALAAQNGLRGADAVYAAVALHANCTLVSLDQEHLTRLTAVVSACTPPAALAETQALLEADSPLRETDSSEQPESQDG